MTDLILVVVLLIILGSAALYIYKAKKRGEKCIGCPYSKQCSNSKCNCAEQNKLG